MPRSADLVHLDYEPDLIQQIVNSVVQVVKHLGGQRRINGLLKLRMLARLGQCFFKAAKCVLCSNDFVVVHVEPHRLRIAADSSSRERVELPVKDLLRNVAELERLAHVVALLDKPEPAAEEVRSA